MVPHVRGEPVGVDTVRREMGHSTDRLVQLVYGHLGDVRHRAEVVEYRVEQHAAVLADRMAVMGGSGTSAGTTQGSSQTHAVENPA